MVEFALVGPFFLLLMFGIIEGSLFMNARAAVDNATHEAARAVAVCGQNLTPYFRGATYQGGCNALAQPVVEANLGFLAHVVGINPQVTVNCLPSPCPGQVTGSGYAGAPTGTILEVEVDYTYTYYLSPFMGQSGPTTHIVAVAQGVAQ
jgi:Flp pilus assembly protein TadG